MIPNMMIMAAQHMGATATDGVNYASLVSVRLDGAGTNGSTTIVDTSPSPKTITRFGNAQISTAQAKYGGSSILLDGTGDYLSIPNSTELSPCAINGATGQRITLEAWIYPLSYGASRGIICKRGATGSGDESKEYCFYLDVSGKVGLVAWNSSQVAVVNILSTSTAPLNQWTHVETSRNLVPRWLIAVNGSVEVTATETGQIGATTQPVLIGRNGPFTDRDFHGYIHVRITSHERHGFQSTFTPPATFAG